MTPARINLSVAEARDLAEGALRGIGYDDVEARIVADHVVDAALCGYEYSGLAKILNIPDAAHFKLPRRPVKALRETDVSLALDGGNNVGMLALFYAAEAAIKKAAAHGLALVSMTDAWMSGRSAYFVEMIAKAGLLQSIRRPADGWWRPPAAPRRCSAPIRLRSRFHQRASRLCSTSEPPLS
jgi:LDH2 family malate/lactate/ureidoglycolate dehydrogenase